jgi:hypothetical protein
VEPPDGGDNDVAALGVRDDGHDDLSVAERVAQLSPEGKMTVASGREAQDSSSAPPPKGKRGKRAAAIAAADAALPPANKPFPT